MQVRVEHLKERWVCVVQHHGPAEAIDTTRRPLYRHMIQHELVGGPSILRHLEPPVGDRHVDALVVTHAGFDGDEICTVEQLASGRYAVADYEGPADGLPKARHDFVAEAHRHGKAAGPVLQVHLMDEMDGVTEQQFQMRLQ